MEQGARRKEAIFQFYGSLGHNFSIISQASNIINYPLRSDIQNFLHFEIEQVLQLRFYKKNCMAKCSNTFFILNSILI